MSSPNLNASAEALNRDEQAPKQMVQGGKQVKIAGNVAMMGSGSAGKVSVQKGDGLNSAFAGKLDVIKRGNNNNNLSNNTFVKRGGHHK
jgi:hypothetical protein